ncbi:MAG: hypothetical protein ABSH28_14510 [Acidobacteriota bacterium]
MAWLVDLAFTPLPILIKTDTGIEPVAHAEVRPTVSFSPDPVKTGYTTDGSADIKLIVTATVDPKDKTDHVEIKTSGHKRVSVANIQRNQSKGTLAFEVRGKSPTDKNKPDGDTMIEAWIEGKLAGGTPAVVVIPAAIGTPHPQAYGVVQPKNLVTDTTTSPPANRLPAGMVALGTYYQHWLTIPVVDQFGNALDSSYDGVPVTENHIPINQKMSRGAYKDPVGRVRNMVPARARDPVALAWPIQPPFPLALPNGQVTANVSVEVGGHSLNPAVVNRTLKWSTAANGDVTVQIIWP